MSAPKPNEKSPNRRPLTPDADELGRRFLEDATESRGKSARKGQLPPEEELPVTEPTDAEVDQA